MASYSYEEFLEKYKGHKSRLFNLISELKSAQSQFDNAADKVKRGRTAAVATTSAGVGTMVLGVLAAPFTFGTSLALTGIGAAATVSGAGTAVGVEVTHDHEVDKAQRNKDTLMEEFIQKIEAVQGKLDKTTVHAKSSLSSEIRGVSSKISSAVSSESIWELEEALKELDRISKEIQTVLKYDI